VTANVDERPELALPVERYDNRQPGDLRRKDAARPAQLAQLTGVLPRAPEDALVLGRGDRRVGVPAVGQRFDAIILSGSRCATA